MVITFSDIEKAHERIAGTAHRTPVLTSSKADRLTGANLFFKCENFQKMGAFKFRGALNALKQFTPEQKAAGVLAYSSGNHAQAIALSAQMLGMEATIVMPMDAPSAKIEATREYGGNVVLYDRYKEDREVIAARIAHEKGMTIIPPYDHPHVMAGQGTATKELFEDVGELDLLLIPLGGGGLLSGGAVVAKEMSPGCRIVGIEPEAGNDGQQSLLKGEIVNISVPKTIADGAQTQHLGQLTFPVLRELVSEVVTVDDTQIVEAMRFLIGRMKIVVEPTGSMGLAAVLANKMDVRGKRVGIILSGGNVDTSRLSDLLAGKGAD